MESEKTQLGKTQKEITIRSSMVQMEDLGTSSPDLEIKLTNNGPAREIEYGISENGRRPDWMPKLQKGDSIAFKLGEMGKGKFLILVNNEFDNAKVKASW